MSVIKIFFATRSKARDYSNAANFIKTDKVVVKDSGKDAPSGQRWYVESQITLQQIFDKGAEHLLKQRKKSLSSGDVKRCMYRSPDNLMCAAGPFISNDAYKPELEGNAIDRYEVTEALLKSGFPVNNSSAMQLLSSLQLCHDSFDVNSWKRRLKVISWRFNLSDKIVEGFK